MTTRVEHQTPLVTILYRFLPQYRVDFFNGLKKNLADSGIGLNLIYGKNIFVSRQDEVDISWAEPIRNHTLRVGPHFFYWQMIPAAIWKSDLIIIMQENKILSNHYVFLRAISRKLRIAFWDHGLNHQADPRSLGNLVKKLYSTKAFWWFAYTNGVKKILVEMDFPESRITVVENAIDTSSLAKEYASVDKDTMRVLRTELSVGDGPVGIFCGGMYKDKRIDFLLAACEKIREQIPTFEMLFIGEGPESHKIKSAAAQKSWIHFVGPKFGSQRVPYFKMADVFLMPGALGLAILDSFATETPLITVQDALHGPELEYLDSNNNGIITEDSIDSFVQGVLTILRCDQVKQRLMNGCRTSAKRYTLENMINRFAQGIKQALDS